MAVSALRRVSLVLLFAIASVAPRAQVEIVSGLPAAEAKWAAGESARAASARAAVLIAADTFERHPTWALPTAATNVESLRHALALHSGIAQSQSALLRGRDVHHEAVRSAIAGAGERLAGAAALLYVHFVGHGWVEAGEQQLFGYYTDEVAGAFTPAIERRQLVAWLGDAQHKASARGCRLEIVLVIDACRVARGAPPPKAKLVQTTLFEVYGSKDGELVAAGDGGEGFAFTSAWVNALTALAERGAETLLDVVFREARDRTLRATTQRQEPVLLAPAGAALPRLVVRPRVSLAVRTVDALNGARVEAVRLTFDATAHELQDATLLLHASPGEHVLTAAAEGFLPRADSLSLTREHTGAELTIPLLPCLTVVRGRLVPPAVLTVRARVDTPPRDGYHVHSATSSPDGRFELRLAATAGARLEIVHNAQVLQAQALSPATGVARHAGGAFDAIPLIELVVPLAAAALAAASDAAVVGPQEPDAPAREPTLDGALDRADWQRAKAAIARGRFDLARSDLRGISSDDAALLAWRGFVDQRWARDVLERALRTGVASGDWSGVQEVNAWLAAADDAPVSKAQLAALRQLSQAVEREFMPLATRVAWNTANAALAASELELALQNFAEARPGANAHYGALIDQQVEQLEARLYARHMSAAAQHELQGDLAAAFLSYADARRYDARAQLALTRLEADARLPDTEPVRAVRAELAKLRAASASAPDAGDRRSIYDSLSFRPQTSDEWLAKAQATRARDPSGTDLFNSLALSTGKSRDRLMRRLTSLQQAQSDAGAALVAIASALDRLLAADAAGSAASQVDLAARVASCRAQAAQAVLAIDSATVAAAGYFDQWRDEVVGRTTVRALRGVVVDIVAGRRATVDAALRALAAADAELGRALDAIEAQVTFAATHPAEESQAMLRRRRAAFAAAVAAVGAQIENATTAVAAATAALRKTQH